MAIRKIKNSWYVDIRFGKKRYRRKSPEDSKNGAKAYETMIHKKLLKGEPIDPEPVPIGKEEITFEKFAWQWFEIYVKNHNKLSEINGKRCVLRTHLVPFFNSTPLNMITGFQIEKYKSIKLKAGLTKKTVNNHLTILNTCLRSAQDWFDMVRIPKINKMKTPPSKFTFFDEEQSRKLLDHSGEWYAMILVALRTGLRLGELRGLMWKDINWDTEPAVMSVRRSIFRNQIVPPKSNKERYIPLTTELCDVLAKMKKNNGYVFRDPDRGSFLEENRPRRAIKKIYEQAGLESAGWHALRHSFASQLAMVGAPLKAIQELLGHADIKTTMRYAHLSPSTLNNTMNLLDPGYSKSFGHQMGTSKSELPFSMRLTRAEDDHFIANVKQKQARTDLSLN